MNQAFPINRKRLSTLIGANSGKEQEVLELLVYNGGECLAAMAYSIRDESRINQWSIAAAELKILSDMTGATLIYEACEQAENKSAASRVEKCDALDILRAELIHLKELLPKLAS